MNPKRFVPVIAVLLVIAIVLSFTVFRNRDRDTDLAASGTVEATEAALGFQMPGRIESVIPHEGDRVKTGDTLASLDRTELRARLSQAEGQLITARALLSEMETGARKEELAQAQAAATAAGQRLTDAQRDFERIQRLVQGGAASQEALDKAKLAVDVATSQRDQAAEQLKLVQAGPRPERVT